MAVFALGDTHLSIACDKPMDIFKGWDSHADRLKANWNRVVGDDDTVVIPGDISWAMTLSQAYEDFAFINALKGKKLILKGNHDYWWNTLKKMNDFLSDSGFDTISFIHNNAVRIGDISVCGTRGWFFDDDKSDEKVLLREAGRLKMSIAAAKKLGGEPVVFLHYPPLSESSVCEEIYSVLESENIKRCYFGHLHGYISPANARILRGGTQFELVSSDYLGFCPKLIEK